MAAGSTSAMILAAGLGTRMRPLTETFPKPLIKVAEKALIEHGLDKLRAAGIERVVVNVHYLADQVAEWAESQAGLEIVISDERDRLLDTGGGVRKALEHLGSEPFFVLNSDSFWRDGRVPALERMRAFWNGADMDCLLLLSTPERSVGHRGSGDFFKDASGRLARAGGESKGSFANTGCYLAAPALFADAPEGAFSTNLLWDRAIAAGRLYGLCHDDLWLHVGTPEAITEAEAALA